MGETVVLYRYACPFKGCLFAVESASGDGMTSLIAHADIEHGAYPKNPVWMLFVFPKAVGHA